MDAIETVRNQIESTFSKDEDTHLSVFLKGIDIDKYTQDSLSLYREAKKEKWALLWELQVFRKELEERNNLYKLFLKKEEDIERKNILEQLVRDFSDIICVVDDFLKTKNIATLSQLKILIKQFLDLNISKESHIKEHYEKSLKKIDTYIKELITLLISELDETNKLIDEFLSIVTSDKNFDHIISLIDHDITQLTTLKTIKETVELLWSGYAEKQLEYYFYALKKWRKLFFYFLQSLFFLSGVDKKEIERRKKNFDLSKMVDFLPQVLKWIVLDSWKEVNITIENEIPERTTYFWIEGDIFYLLYNAVKNAKRHGDASMVKFSVKNNMLIISDNGTWIRWIDKATLFNRGVSGGNSSWLWLRDTDKRGISIKALNKWKKNKDWKFWARFEIEIQKRK